MKNKNKNTKSQSQNSSEDLRDLKLSGKKRPWDKNKRQSLAVSNAYYLMPGLEKYGEKIASCGNFLKLGACCHIEHGKSLLEAYFCRARLCIMCQWRKSLVIRKQVIDLARGHLERFSTDIPLVLTLTVVNSKSDDLKKTIDEMGLAWKRLVKLKVVKGAVRSWFRSLEVTYNEDREDYHPHYHAVLMVPHRYFRKESGLYIPHEKWLELWKQSMRDDRITQVDIRTAKCREEATLESLIGEVAKYATKPSSYIFENQEGKKEAQSNVIGELHHALKGRRLIGFGGVFKEIRKEQKMVDVEDADLVHINENDISKKCSCKICGSTLLEEIYAWNFGVEKYQRDRLQEKKAEDWKLSEADICGESCCSASAFEAVVRRNFLSEEGIENLFGVEVLVVKKEYSSCGKVFLNKDKRGRKPSLLLMCLRRRQQKRKEIVPLYRAESSLVPLRGPP